MPSNVVKNSDRLIAKFKKLSKVTQQRYMENAVKAGALPILADAVNRVPKVSGNLARSLHIEIE
jgi:hypothetical protein